MLNYIIFSVVIDYLVLICMISMIHRNKVLDHIQRVGFITSFSLILFVSTIELISIFIDYKAGGYKYLNLILLNLYLLFAPLVPILYAGSLTGFTHKSYKYIIGIYGLYSIFIILAIPFKLIFYIDSSNNYVRNWGYPVFIAAYVLFKLYLIYMCYMKVKRFKNANWFALIVLLIAFIAGSSVQLYDSKIHTAWACLTLILIVYYAYYNELARQLDEMTDMYSHQAYITNSKNLKKGDTLIIMDCDKFKELNDTYGHAEGDKCLIAIADCIKMVFMKYGICYRIGGDEFAVIVNKPCDIDALVKELAGLIKSEREANKLLPTLSIGYLVYDGDDDILRFREAVDKEMYKAKKMNNSFFK